MKLPKTPIRYRWTAQDAQSAVMKAPVPPPQTEIEKDADYWKRRITPYGFLPEGLRAKAGAQVGKMLEINLNDGIQFPYHTWRYSEERWHVFPEDTEWEAPPQKVLGCATIGELCKELQALGAAGDKKYAGIYDAFKDFDSKATTIKQRELARSIFDFWDNTDYRYAVTLLPQFTPTKAFHEPWTLPIQADAPDLYDASGKTVNYRLLKVAVHPPARVAVSGGPSNGAKPNTVAEPPKGQRPKMKVGYNYAWAWNQYGSYLGATDWRAKWLDYLPRDLRLLKSIGFTHVRIFLLCNGWDYGQVVEKTIGPPPMPSEFGASSTHMIFEPPERPNPLYFEQFKRMLDIFRAVDLKVIPSFVDFHLSLSTPRYQAIIMPEKKPKLLAVLDEFLKVSSADVIYAWEVMNEPNWTTPPLGHARGGGQLITRQELSTFLAEACARIEAHGFDSTVGHRFISDLSTFPTGKKRQFHYYAKYKTFQLPPTGAGATMSPSEATPIAIGTDPLKVPTFAESQAFIGEFHGTKDEGWPWWELKGRDKGNVKTALLERLKHLARLGYELALVWPDISYADIDPMRPYQGDDAKGTGKHAVEWAEFAKNPYSTMAMSIETARAVEEFTTGLYRNGIPDPIE